MLRHAISRTQLVSSRLSHQSRCYNGHGDAQQTHATTSLQLILCMVHCRSTTRATCLHQHCRTHCSSTTFLHRQCRSAVDSRISLAATMGMGMHSRPMPQHHYSSSYACCTAGQQPELHASTGTAGQQPELHSPTSTAGPTAAQLHASTSTAGQ